MLLGICLPNKIDLKDIYESNSMYEEAILEFLMKTPGEHTTNEVIKASCNGNWYKGLKELMRLKKMGKISFHDYGSKDKFWYVVE